MNIALINPPNNCLDTLELAPPLGLLSLAEMAQKAGHDTTLIDLNLESCAGALSEDGFYESVNRRILDTSPDLVCFTSMGINSHVSLLLARQLKVTAPRVRNVFGGAHFSSISHEVCSAYPFVDYVICGEADSFFPQLLRQIECGSVSSKITSLAGTSSEISSALSHPWLAYNSIDVKSYFGVNPRRVLNYESARGCKYACSFCYSPSHWKTLRYASIDSVVSDFQAAEQRGFRHLFLVEDNFLNDRQRARALLTELSESRHGLTWNCYATIRDIDEELSEQLRSAGCSSVYIGIDAVTPFQKRVFGKNHFRSESEALNKIELLVHVGVQPTCAFIVDPFEWSEEEIEESLRAALKYRMIGASLSFHVLTTYAQTRIARRKLVCRPDNFRTATMFDCPGIVSSNPLVTDYPALFPFHTRPIDNPEEYRRGVLMLHVSQNLLTHFPFELHDLVRSEETSLVGLFRSLASDLSVQINRGLSTPQLKEAARLLAIECLENKYGFQAVTV